MRRASGAVNPITVLIIVAVIGGAYWLAMFGPKHLDNLDVKDAAASAVAQARNHTDEQVVQMFLVTTQRIGWHREEDPESGELVEKPGLNLAPENVTFIRDESSNTVTFAVHYSREVHLLPFNKWTQANFTVEKGGSIAP